MKNGICYVVGSGENFGLDFKPNREDLVIAADGGFDYLTEAGIVPDMAIGDFDSLGRSPECANVVRLSTKKDDTDMLAAVREGMKAGYGEFQLYCGTGGRIDHTLANVQLLAFLAKSGKRGCLLDRESVMTAITDGTLEFDESHRGVISVFSLSDRSTGVFEKGLLYELDDATLENTFPVGVSNEFTGTASSVSVRNGTLLVVYGREQKGLL